jgi:hypothetical protein
MVRCILPRGALDVYLAVDVRIANVPLFWPDPSLRELRVRTGRWSLRRLRGPGSRSLQRAWI